MDEAGSGKIGVNEAGTCQQIDTHLTRAGSLDVRAGLIAKRVKFGAKTPKGRACSTLIEQLQNLQTATGKQKENLHKLIRQSIARLNSE